MFSVNVVRGSCSGYFLSGVTKLLLQAVRGLRGLHRQLEMRRAYLRYLEGSDKFELSVHVQYDALGVDRQFNFSRQVSENVNTLTGRITTNLEKVFSRHEKKKKNKGKSIPSSEDKTEIVVYLLHNGKPVNGDELCRDILLGRNDLSLIICDTEYNIIFNSPWIDALTLPSTIMAGFPVYPSKFESSFALRSKCTFQWYSNHSESGSGKWSHVGSDYYYVPTSKDLGCLLKLECIPGNENAQGPPVDVESKTPVIAGPEGCPFEARHSLTEEKVQWPSFRVISYNILADLYADSDTARNELFPYCPASALKIDYRKQLFCRELLGYNADIICLQEVDKKVFHNDLEPLLSCSDFQGVFESKGNGQVSEGLACFYQTSKFRLLESHNICFAAHVSSNPIFEDLWEQVKDNENLMARFMERTTSLLVLVLECVEDPSEILLVGNTHLYFHPDADHIRLLQAGMIVRFLESMVANITAFTPGKHTSVLQCGDYNSTPECGVFQLMTTQYVPGDHIDWSSNAEQAVTNVSLSHSLPLASACGTPLCTNFTAGFVGCLDYIFYQRDVMSVEQVVSLPPHERLQEHVALPSLLFPSDHLALVCELRLQLQGR